MRLLWLPEVLRNAGLQVHTVSGWKTRGNEHWGPVRGIIVHHTAGGRNSTDTGEINTLLHGSQTAPAPIAQLYLSRTGAWHVVATGVCFHALEGWGGPNQGLGNWNLLGVEAQHSGGTEPWTDRHYRSYVTGVAALVTKLGIPVSRVAGHKEHQPRDKSDPTFDMDRFRADVRAAMKGDDDMPLTTKDERIIQHAVHNTRIGRSTDTFGTVLGSLRTVPAAVTELRTLAAAVLGAVQGLDTAAVLARVDEAAAAAAARDGQVAARLAEQLAPALADAIRDELDDVEPEQLQQASERALRRVLADLADDTDTPDGAAPAPGSNPGAGGQGG